MFMFNITNRQRMLQVVSKRHRVAAEMRLVLLALVGAQFPVDAHRRP